MARRMSNRDRIQRMQLEAKATAGEKKKKKPAKAAKKRAKKPAKAAKKPEEPPGRMKMVWAVCDRAARTVKTFPYPEKAQAQAEAVRLTTKNKAEHFVRSERVPME